MEPLWNPVAISAPPPRLHGDHRRFVPRVAPRVAVDLTAPLRQQGHSAIDTRIHNLSTHGFMADSLYRMRLDTLLWLRLPGLAPLPARVRWFDAHRIGCLFEAPLHVAVRDRIVAACATG